jgi:hypothetical protein
MKKISGVPWAVIFVCLILQLYVTLHDSEKRTWPWSESLTITILGLEY